MISKILYDLSVLFGHQPDVAPICEQGVAPTYETFEQQPDRYRMSAVDVNKIILDTTGLNVQCNFNNADLTYKLTDIQTLKSFTAENNLARYTYEKNDKDCDDFSFMLQGDVTHWDSDLAFGIIWGIRPNGDGHAWNMTIGTDLNVWFIEPQTNTVFKPKKLWEITLLTM